MQAVREIATGRVAYLFPPDQDVSITADGLRGPVCANDILPDEFELVDAPMPPMSFAGSRLIFDGAWSYADPSFARIEDGAVSAYPLFDDGDGLVEVADTPMPVVGPGQSIAEGTPALDDGTWRRTWIVSDAPVDIEPEPEVVLTALKDNARREIEARRDACFAAGFTVPTGPLAGHVLQTGTIEDRTNWLTSQAAYSAAVAMGMGEVQEAYFRTAANQTIAVTYREGLEVLLMMAAWGRAVMGRSWALKDAVVAASDKDSLAAIDLTNRIETLEAV